MSLKIPRTIVRAALATSVGGVALVATMAMLGAFGSRADGAAAVGLDPAFPGYPGGHLFSMGEGLSVDGVPLQLGYFSAEAKPIDVARFYADAWRARDFSVTYTVRDDHAEVGAYDVAEQRMRSVSVVRSGGRVTVFCSSMPLAGRQIQNASGHLAVPDHALFVQRSSSHEGGRLRESLSYVLMDELEPARDSLIAAMKHDGWSVGRVRASQKRPGVTLRFERGEEHAMSTLIADAQTGAVGVQTFETLGGAGP